MIFTKAPTQNKNLSIVSLKDRRREEKLRQENVVNVSSSANKDSKLNEMLMSLELTQQGTYLLGSGKSANTGTPVILKNSKRSDSSSKQKNTKKVNKHNP